MRERAADQFFTKMRPNWRISFIVFFETERDGAESIVVVFAEIDAVDFVFSLPFFDGRRETFSIAERTMEEGKLIQEKAMLSPDRYTYVFDKLSKQIEKRDQ